VNFLTFVITLPFNNWIKEQKIYDIIKDDEKYKNKIAEIKSVKGIHLVKIKKPGYMKPRYICFETNNQKGEQVLFLFGDGGVFTFNSPQ
jgi:hypothetical protein